MIVSFFGHSSFSPKEGDLERIIALLEKEIKGESVEFYVGRYGGFDRFSFDCAKTYQKPYPNSKIIYVSPYLDMSRFKEFIEKCDGAIYPEIEKVPLKYAIIERNKWVVRQSDLIIFYYVIAGGVGIVYDYAVSKDKKLINLYSKG